MTDQLAADEVDDAPHGRAHDGSAVDDSSADRDDRDDRDENAPPGSRRRQARISRWDRPPQPRDWRFYVGGTGKILIAAGLLIFGFVAYQLWGTGIETARAQHQLENEFEELLGEFGGADAITPVADNAPALDDTTDIGSDGSADPDVETEAAGGAIPVNDPAVRTDDELSAAPQGQASSSGAETAAVPVAVDLSDQAVVQDPIPQPFRGDPLLRLEIPKIGRDDIVVPGVALNDLKDGPGHYPDTPLPGQLGNAAIAGHRTTYGAPFYDVDQLSAGDEIITTLLNGDRFVYEVTHVEVVGASDYWVVTTTNPNIAELTLTSCHPKYTARDRIVVHSVLNPAKSANVGVPSFYSLEVDPDDAPIPGDDPVLTTAAGETGVTGDIEVTPPAERPDAPAQDGSTEPIAETDNDANSETTPAGAADAPGASESAASESAASTPAGTADAPTPVDAFEEGWFDDAGAFPQIALWGLVLALISLGAYQVAKRFRRVWVGLTLGILPFLVAIFFFYQNVNRLLPAGI